MAAAILTWAFIGILIAWGGMLVVCQFIALATHMEHPRWYIALMMWVYRLFKLPFSDYL